MAQQLLFSRLKEGQELPEVVNSAITRVQLVKYAGASGDFNPLHTVDSFAEKAGLDGVIAHGMLSMGFLGKYVREIIAEHGDIKKISVRFSRMARPGDTLTCRGKVISLSDDGKHSEFEVSVSNQHGEKVTSGTCLVHYF